MFFIFGINERRKDYDFNQMVICGRCGSYGSYRVFMTCMCLSLFFIPIVKPIMFRQHAAALFMNWIRPSENGSPPAKSRKSCRSI